MTSRHSSAAITDSLGNTRYGYIELRAGDGEDFYWWFGSHVADDQLALFGAGPDGSLICIWKQDDGREPIVHLGSEGDALKVLAANMKEFIVLLAIGYGELGHEDLSKPPVELDDANPEFQKWVEATFGVEIPENGIGIAGSARESHADFAGPLPGQSHPGSWTFPNRCFAAYVAPVVSLRVR